MVRILNALLLATMVIGAGITYDMKHKAEEAANKVARLQVDIARERDRISVLRAEWSMLTQPSRLQAVISRYADHFDLQPFAASQIASLADIPEKPAGAKPADMKKALAEADLSDLIRRVNR